MQTVKWPYGEATIEQLTASGEQNIPIEDIFTIIDGESVPGTANRTINLDVNASRGVKPGALILLKVKSTAGNTIWGSSISYGTGNPLSSPIASTAVGLFVYDGSKFIGVQDLGAFV